MGSPQLQNLKKIDGSPITDFSWAHPVSNKTCWEKAHEFYIPQGLFSAPKMKREKIDGRLVFDSGNLKTKNELFIKRKLAKGEKINKSRATGKRKNPPVVPEIEVTNEAVAITQDSETAVDAVDTEEFVTVEL